MAPLHHHFELCGWSEVKLVTIFTLVSAVFCMLALWGVIGRYHFYGTFQKTIGGGEPV